jgi:mannose-1-phosphate guanylyltransferase
VGVRDLVVVDTPDALLVCNRSEVQRIKEIISRLEDQGRSDLL